MERGKVCVLGAGIIGLSSAVCIQTELPRVDVTIIADRFSPDTTGDGSAGLWKPHPVEGGQTEYLLKWSRTTFEYLHDLVKSPDAGEVGAVLLPCYRFGPKEDSSLYRNQVFGFRDLTEAERQIIPENKLASSYWYSSDENKSGTTFTSLALDVKSYMPWLMKKFKSKGGIAVKKNVSSLEEIAKKYDVVVNCTGLGSRKLLNDKEIRPHKGHTIRVHAPWLRHCYIDSDYRVYILPGARDVTLGGGWGGIDNWSTETDQEEADYIWEKCCMLVPSLKRATILYNWTGLRPSRSKIRLEVDHSCTKIVHNYGHGSAGVTLHWGCAKEAVNLVKSSLVSQNSKL